MTLEETQQQNVLDEIVAKLRADEMLRGVSQRLSSPETSDAEKSQLLAETYRDRQSAIELVKAIFNTDRTGIVLKNIVEKI